MQTNMEKIQEMLKLHENIVLFQPKGRFGAVFQAAVKNSGKQVFILDDNRGGGNNELRKYPVIVCNRNEIYAEGTQKMLLESGYQSVFVPKDFGLVDSVDKLDGLEFNLNIGCSLNCHYCPQKVLLNAYQRYGKNPYEHHLTFENFKFIVDERMNPGATVGFSGMSEPFENNDFYKMLFYASKNGNNISVNTTLMGLRNSVLDEMIKNDIQFGQCILHVPDNKGNSHFKITDEYLKVLKKFISYYSKNIITLSCHGDSLHDAVREIVEKSEVERIGYENVLGSRCGNLDGEIVPLPLAKKGKIVCTLGAPKRRSPVCMPDGTLGLCCNDYALDTCIGNILDDDWGTIASGKGYQEYLNALENDNKRYICRYCLTAKRKSEAISSIYPDYFCFGDNYYQVRGLVEKGEHELAKRLREAEHICIFGLGKFFKDNYFLAGWNNIIHADLLSDNNESLWGRSFGGIPIVPKHQLLSYRNLLVVVYVTNSQPVIESLHSIGIENVISIGDIMNVFGVD